MNAPSRDKVGTTGLAVLPRINLIPTEIADRRSLRHLQAGLGGAGLAAVGIVVLLLVMAMGSVSSARTDLTNAQTENTAVHAKVAGLQNVAATFALVDQAHGALRDAGGREVLWSTYLTDLSLRVPDSVWLTGVKVTAIPAPVAGSAAAAAIGQISFEGVALSHDDVAKWLDSIAKERGWSDPYFTRSELKLIGGRATYSFTSTVNVTEAALSGRYTKSGS
jgi:Tfp pilus assembly protein PilN